MQPKVRSVGGGGKRHLRNERLSLELHLPLDQEIRLCTYCLSGKREPRATIKRLSKRVDLVPIGDLAPCVVALALADIAAVLVALAVAL